MDLVCEMGGQESIDRVMKAVPAPEDRMHTDEWMYEMQENGDLDTSSPRSNARSVVRPVVEAFVDSGKLPSGDEDNTDSEQPSPYKSQSRHSLTALSKTVTLPPLPVPPDGRPTSQMQSKPLRMTQSPRKGSSPSSKYDPNRKPSAVSSTHMVAIFGDRDLIPAPSGPPPASVFYARPLAPFVLSVGIIVVCIVVAEPLAYVAAGLAAAQLLPLAWLLALKNEPDQRSQLDTKMLNTLIPGDVVTQLHRGDAIAVTHSQLTFCFTDLVGFTKATAHLPAIQLLRGLNELFTVFDSCAVRFGITKVKTIGDCYMAVAGFRQRSFDHIKAMHDWCFGVLEEFASLSSLSASELGVEKISLRFGMSTGPAVSGVLGTTKPVYDFWGDTVNMASRMESLSKPNRVNCTEEVANHLKEKHAVEVDVLSDVFVKGKGWMNTYLIVPTGAACLLVAQTKNVEDPWKSQALQQLENMQSKEAFGNNLKFILSAVSELSAATELQTATRLLIGVVKKLIRCDRATLFMVDEEKQQLWSYHSVTMNASNNTSKIRMPLGKGIAGWSASRGESIVIPDAYEDSRFNSSVDFKTGYRTKNVLCCPVKRGNQVLAVIQAINKFHGCFNDQDTALLELLGNQTGIHLMYGQLILKYEAAVLRTVVLGELASELNSAQRVEQLVTAVPRDVKELMQCEEAMMHIVNEKRTHLCSINKNGERIISPLSNGDAVHVKAARSGELINVKDTAVEATSSQYHKTAHNILCVPVLDKKTTQLVGVIEAANCFNTGVDNKVHYVPFGADLEIALTTYAVYVQSAMSAMSLRAAADRVNKSGAIIKKMDALPKTMSRAACEEALRKIMCSEIPDAFEAQAAALWFIDHGKLRTVSSDGISLCTDAVGIVGAVGTGQIRVFNSAENVVAHPSYKAAIDNVHGFPIETVIALPLSQAGTCLGVLQVVNKTTLGVTAFTDEEQTILQQIATIAAMHLSCAQ